MYPVKRIKGAKLHISQNSDKMVEYLTFPGLEQLDCIKHLFSTRLGGASEGIYSSMNLSFTRGDEEEKVFANFDRIGAVLGVEREQFVLSHQTHTDHIRIVTKEDAGAGFDDCYFAQD